jgi:hypothetical protein
MGPENVVNQHKTEVNGRVERGLSRTPKSVGFANVGGRRVTDRRSHFSALHRSIVRMLVTARLLFAKVAHHIVDPTFFVEFFSLCRRSNEPCDVRAMCPRRAS